MLEIQRTGQKDGFNSLISVQTVGLPEQVPVGPEHNFLQGRFQFKCGELPTVTLEVSQPLMSLHLLTSELAQLQLSSMRTL